MNSGKLDFLSKNIYMSLQEALGQETKCNFKHFYVQKILRTTARNKY